MKYSPGLRVKFNAVVLPVLALTFGVMVAADYRHEKRSVMAAHQMHASAEVIGSAVPTPVDPATTPEAAARRSLLMHGAFAGVLLGVALLAVNATLSFFVLRPLGRIREGCSRLERGHWYPSNMPRSGDEMGDALRGFQDLGLRLDAFVGQALQAERLATLALLAQSTSTRIEPEVERIGVSLGRLRVNASPAGHEDLHAIAAAAAAILSHVRGLHHAFAANFGRTKGGTHLE